MTRFGMALTSLLAPSLGLVETDFQIGRSQIQDQ
jgi:hypothetical protein